MSCASAPGDGFNFNKTMMIKRYVEHLILQCSDQSFGQQAVEWAILQGKIKLTYDLQTDLKAIHAPLPQEPVAAGEKPVTFYDRIIEEYQVEVQGHTELLMQSYGPLLEEIQTFPSNTSAL